MKVLITGASSGIGRDMARYLDSLGYELILVSRSEEDLNKLATSLKNKSMVIPMDLSKSDNCYKLYDRVKTENVDWLINNAGFGLLGNTWELSLDKELEMLDLNVRAVHILTRLFLDDMVKRNSGRILNVASSAAFLPGPSLNTYYATKNYVAKWSIGLYEELRRKNINVHISCLCPGPVNTNFDKVAGVKFSMKGLSSEYVAKYAIDKALKNKLVIIPGLSVRLGLFFSRFLSYKSQAKTVYNIQKKKGR